MATPNPLNPLVVQSDRTALLEVASPLYRDARDELALFAELEKSPEHFHTYRITPLSIWNAAAAGLGADRVIASLERFSKYDVPQNVSAEIRDLMARYGKVRLVRDAETEELRLVCDDRPVIVEIARSPLSSKFLIGPRGTNAHAVDPAARGEVKRALLKLGFPVEDLAGYVDGAPLEVEVRSSLANGEPFALRAYQREAVENFWAGGSLRGGSGVVALPCGAGKTIVGIGVIALLKTRTLVLTTNITALRQWKSELLERTTLREDEVGEYSGERKEIRPVTIATYQILTHRKAKTDEFSHFGIFFQNQWGLIVYDEVHLLPAPIFRVTAEIQARRRLGLTATLVREDGKEEDVFTLIGPKRHDVPWKVLERQGWIAPARCIEVRLPLAEHRKMEHALAAPRDKFRIAAENEGKVPLVKSLVRRHADDLVLVIGQYLSQLRFLARVLDAPLLTGATPNDTRERLYADFKEGRVRCLVVSKVANFAVDLPEANVAIQVSGTFGSRQEEAQRLGRILRPKRDKSKGGATFYSLVTRDSREQDFASKRQLFLAEQGYGYEIRDSREFLLDAPTDADPDPGAGAGTAAAAPS
jgi:DNA excision repair protein ERCC-3